MIFEGQIQANFIQNILRNDALNFVFDVCSKISCMSNCVKKLMIYVIVWYVSKQQLKEIAKHILMKDVSVLDLALLR